MVKKNELYENEVQTCCKVTEEERFLENVEKIFLYYYLLQKGGFVTNNLILKNFEEY